MEIQRPYKIQSNSEKEAGRLKLPDFRTYYITNSIITIQFSKKGKTSKWTLYQRRHRADK